MIVYIQRKQHRVGQSPLLLHFVQEVAQGGGVKPRTDRRVSPCGTGEVREARACFSFCAKVQKQCPAAFGVFCGKTYQHVARSPVGIGLKKSRVKRVVGHAAALFCKSVQHHGSGLDIGCRVGDLHPCLLGEACRKFGGG